MASFLIGKSLKDRRQIKAIEELFNKADKNGNGKIFVSDYIHIFTDHGIELKEEEIEKVSGLANEDGEIVRDEFISYAKNSDFFKSQMDKNDADSVISKQEAIAKAERAFKLFDKDNDGFITKDEFQKISKKLSKDQIEAVFSKFDKDGDGVLSFEEFRKMLNK
uniref:EF-hand domain-containing protein n=1 Tax=Lepeophtheirus salmonis TaxID=72036 RepID=A0A0K2TNY7_LEPSM